jgi:flavin-dependent thymidylate synthase
VKVSLINFTQDALPLLLGTKNTRLGADEDPRSWPDAKRSEHLAYMRDTIKSSWEFVDYVFEIECTRACAQQIERTRSGAYAEQSLRVVDARKFEVHQPEVMKGGHRTIWNSMIDSVMRGYAHLIDDGMAVQDARGLLPLNTMTKLKAKFDLRTLHNMALVRLCTRTQGEYQQVFREMRRLVLEVHPWVGEHRFLEVHCVSTGTCAFPRYGRDKCPIYHYEMDTTEVKDRAYNMFWASKPHEADPAQSTTRRRKSSASRSRTGTKLQTGLKPCRSPYCECEPGKCTHPGFFDARGK